MIVVAIIGILAAISVPNYMKFQARARQSEAKVQLQSAFAAATSYFAQYGTYNCGSCGFAPGTNTVYTYATSSSNTWKGLNDCGTVSQAAQSTDAFTMAASGNIDSDATCDVWTMNDANALSNTTNDVDQ